ncbi:hypothetical protein J6590_031758 [Homalodisca vitripennis]|nr:hypothetical protein J6590_031758 [Homalodisca vitripennis]
MEKNGSTCECRRKRRCNARLEGLTDHVARAVAITGNTAATTTTTCSGKGNAFAFVSCGVTARRDAGLAVVRVSAGLHQ